MQHLTAAEANALIAHSNEVRYCKNEAAAHAEADRLAVLEYQRGRRDYKVTVEKVGRRWLVFIRRA